MRNAVRLRMRDLIHASLDELMAHPQVPIYLECDDGEELVIIEEVILSWFLWEYHRVYPETPCLTRHVMSNLVLTPKTHMRYLGIIQKDAFFASRSYEYESLLEYNKVAYRVYNDLYNFIVTHLSAYMTSISILDYLDVMDNPHVREANDKVIYGEHTTSKEIGEAYKEITNVLATEESLKDNPLSVAFNHKLVSIDQILQDIAPRGFVSDVDSHIFKHPIRVGYAEGMSTLRDYICESRTGTTSDMMTGEPMQASEYLNRLLQMSLSRVKHVFKGDCGTDMLFSWYVRSKSKLQDLHGIYYLNEDTGLREPIDPSIHEHLVGKMIQIRLVFGCKHMVRSAVCAKCYGDLAFSIHDTDAIGHLSAIEHQSPQTQTILSFKHLTGSASEFGIGIDELASNYFDIHANEHTTFVREDIDLTDHKFILSLDAMHGFESLTKVDTWSKVSPSRISHILHLTMVKPDGEVLQMRVADVDNPVFFSMDALKFLVNTKVNILPNGDYEFDMTGWDNTKPMFRIPKTQFDVVAYTESLETFVKGPKTSDKRDKQSTIIDFTHPLPALWELHEMVSLRLHVNITHLQCVILASMCEDPDNNDYRLPLDRCNGRFVSHDTIMRKSSPVVALGYEDQQTDIFCMNNYLGIPRSDSIYDTLLMGVNNKE